MTFPFPGFVPAAVSHGPFGGNDANTILLLHCDGTNGSTSFPDSSALNHTVSAGGTAQVSTANFKFGTGSFTPGSGNLTCSSAPEFNFGSSDFTIDFWAAVANVTGFKTAVTKRPAGGNGSFLIMLNANNWQFYASSAGATFDIINGTNFGTMSTGLPFHHIAVVRQGSTFTGYLDGVGTVLGTSAAAIQSNALVLSIGADNNATQSIGGNMDEIRISNVARFTANFTPPTLAYF